MIPKGPVVDYRRGAVRELNSIQLFAVTRMHHVDVIEW